MRLERVDRVTRHQRHDLAVVVEVTTVHDRAVVGDLHGDVAVGGPGERHLFLVSFDRLHETKSQVLQKRGKYD